jgi:hypothetical protein
VSSVKRPEPPLEILEAWGQRGVPIDAPEDAVRRREAVVGSMGRLIREEKRRRLRRTRWIWSIGAAAAVAFAGAVYLVRPAAPPSRPVAAAEARGASLQVTSGLVVTLRGDAATSVYPGSPHALSPSDEIRVGQEARGTALLPRGVRVDFAPETRATLVSAGEVEQRFRLAQGMLTVSVPRPGGPRTFAISTPDTEVVVHGTQFSTRVERTPNGVARTFVQVTRGAVLVVRGDSESLVRAGQSWASPDPDAMDQRLQASPAAIAAGARPPSGGAAASSAEQDNKAGHADARAAAARGRAATDALAEQNRLFQAALDARAAGDDAAVVRHLDRLLVRFPRTELAREARLTRFRALKRLGREGEAAREAGRYLLEHPDGPSRGEARDVSAR